MLDFVGHHIALVLGLTLGLGMIVSYILYSFFYIKKLKVDKKELHTILQQKDEALALKEQEKIRLETANVWLEKQLPQAQEAMAQATKTAVLQSAQELSSKLLDDYKREHKHASQKAEEKITHTTKEMTTHVENIAKGIVAYGKEIENNKEQIHKMQKGLFEPIKGGVLSETILENMLQCCGFEKGRDYVTQLTVKGAEYQSLRPDVLVFLHDERVLVIDSKSSPQFFSDDVDDEAIIKRLRTHMKGLSSKGYHNAVKEATLSVYGKDYKVKQVTTFMFLPTDHVLSRVQKMHVNIMQEAMGYGIMLGGPSVLWAVLSVFNMEVRAERQSKNYDKMILEVEMLLKHMNAFSKNAKNIESTLVKAVEAYNKFAANANGRFLSKGKKIQKMGGFEGSREEVSHLPQIMIQKMETIDHNDLENDDYALPYAQKEEEEK